MSDLVRTIFLAAAVTALGACGDSADAPASAPETEATVPAPIPTAFTFDGANDQLVSNTGPVDVYELSMTLTSGPQPPHADGTPTHTETYPPMPFTSAPLTAYVAADTYNFRLMPRQGAGEPEPEQVFVPGGAVAAPTRIRLVNLPASALLIVDGVVVWSGGPLAGLPDIKLGSGYLKRMWAGEVSDFAICAPPETATVESVTAAPAATFCAASPPA